MDTMNSEFQLIDTVGLQFTCRIGKKLTGTVVVVLCFIIDPEGNKIQLVRLPEWKDVLAHWRIMFYDAFSMKCYVPKR